jgi:hypothetical protein
VAAAGRRCHFGGAKTTAKVQAGVLEWRFNMPQHA